MRRPGSALPARPGSTCLGASCGRGPAPGIDPLLRTAPSPERRGGRALQARSVGGPAWAGVRLRHRPGGAWIAADPARPRDAMAGRAERRARTRPRRRREVHRGIDAAGLGLRAIEVARGRARHAAFAAPQCRAPDRERRRGPRRGAARRPPTRPRQGRDAPPRARKPDAPPSRDLDGPVADPRTLPPSPTAPRRPRHLGRGALLPRRGSPAPTGLRAAEPVEAETARIDALVTETERSITPPREKRSALITAARTGQIDMKAVSWATRTTRSASQLTLSIGSWTGAGGAAGRRASTPTTRWSPKTSRSGCGRRRGQMGRARRPRRREGPCRPHGVARVRARQARHDRRPLPRPRQRRCRPHRHVRGRPRGPAQRGPAASPRLEPPAVAPWRLGIQGVWFVRGRGRAAPTRCCGQRAARVRRPLSAGPPGMMPQRPTTGGRGRSAEAGPAARPGRDEGGRSRRTAPRPPSLGHCPEASRSARLWRSRST